MAMSPRRFGDELVNDKTYFTSRSWPFWTAVSVMVCIGTAMGLWQAVFATFYVDIMLGRDAAADTKIVQAAHMRGTIALTLTCTWLFAFYRRMALARYAVYFATCFVAVKFATDLGSLAMSADRTVTIASSSYVILRPVMLIALTTTALGLYDSARFERRKIKPGQTLWLSELT